MLLSIRSNFLLSMSDFTFSCWLCRHDAFFCFHNINAFEAGDDLIVDLAAYKDHQVLADLHRSNLLFGKPVAKPTATR